MRESNFAFPAQNKACVCITSQLYDRRALDTTSPLPLFNSLTHLTYLTSTSPRIREIMTMDGGLERLVRILHEFCMCPPPPENPAIFHGLMPPSARPPKLSPALNPPTFDKHAAYRFSLAFQCIVNIGVRGSEPIRSRVVQAGTLDVVGCILEAWLANKGFAVGPSAGAIGVSREQRHQRKLEQRQREDALQLQRALQRQLHAGHPRQRQDTRNGTLEEDESMDFSPAEMPTSQILLLSDTISQPSNTASNSDTDISTDNSLAATPLESSTPTGSVVIPSRYRSGTIIARPVWDPPTQVMTGSVGNFTPPTHFNRNRRARHRELPPDSPSTSTDVSRPETETEDDGDVDMDPTGDRRIDSDVASASASPSPERQMRNAARQHMARRAVGIVSDEPTAVPQTLQVGGLDTDAHIIINEGGGVGVGDGGVEVGVGVVDGIVSLEQNDDFAMGAPPGAPGALGETPTPRGLDLAAATGPNERRRRNTVTVDAPDVTPRAAVVNLPLMTSTGTVRPQPTQNRPAELGHQRNATIRARPADGAVVAMNASDTVAMPATGSPGELVAPAMNTTPTNTFAGVRGVSSSHGFHHHRDSDSGPYRDEDVLLSLQLLAYLSKYPHVRQAFYKPRVTFHPASVNLGGVRFGLGVQQHSAVSCVTGKQKEKEKEKVPSTSSSSIKEGILKTFTSSAYGGSGTSSRGKEKERQPIPSSVTGPSSPSVTPVVLATTVGNGGAPSSARQTNVFSLVERFTYKPSSTDSGDGINSPPRLPPEIQYWAGVIMRNACRKDDSRGGIRQCANMMCGKWESYPREFAKCRRCRKAKYCGKECQSTAWSEGHRFWCSAKDVDDEPSSHQSNNVENFAASSRSSGIQVSDDGTSQVTIPMTGGSGSRTERRQHRERQHHHHGVSGVAHSSSSRISPTTASGVRTDSDIVRDRTVQSLMPPQQLGYASPHVRSRLTNSIRHPGIQHDPMNSSYLSFHIQGSPGPSGDRESGRRRPEIVTTGLTPGPSGSNAAGLSPSLTSRRTLGLDIPPDVVVPASPVRLSAGAASQHLQMSYTQTITQANVHSVGTGQLRVVEDWPMGSPSPTIRRFRTREQTGRSLGDDGEDMVLG